ncbi:hypothetical protein JX265_010216 [Neoarthrinium moseri]|uniref:Uncharacterized protein n=1 Tax=Neoarthrinium moseri TaxID=1658444 RepID=A0A9P9WEQ2_9PEZI|nr:uncharacterized protein JN550_010456 [Neoarthrinium moseri]KAI1859767.1 hypothetical protein JX265_010216 [Neoarthrinium moseri]KAI1862153.1 hypothetical protein JN550_010456 [Neoarthrinium moseri]
MENQLCSPKVYLLADFLQHQLRAAAAVGRSLIRHVVVYKHVDRFGQYHGSSLNAVVPTLMRFTSLRTLVPVAMLDSNGYSNVFELRKLQEHLKNLSSLEVMEVRQYWCKPMEKRTAWAKILYEELQMFAVVSFTVPLYAGYPIRLEGLAWKVSDAFNIADQKIKEMTPMKPGRHRIDPCATQEFCNTQNIVPLHGYPGASISLLGTDSAYNESAFGGCIRGNNAIFFI